MTDIFTQFSTPVRHIRDENNNTYVHVKNDGDYWRLLKVPSSQFELFVRNIFYTNGQSAPNNQKIAEIIENTRSKCLFSGELHNINIRTASLQNGGIEIDLGNENNDCIQITASGWEIKNFSENLFYRPDAQKPLPYPVNGGNINTLKTFVNYENENDFNLIVGFILGAFRPNCTYTHLILQGEQGCGKTTVTKVIKSLVDNSTGILRGLPHDTQTLFIGTQNAHLLSFDNLSGMRGAQSDDFCRLATGGAFNTRRLYSNAEEFSIEARKPVIVNGIDNIASRPDLVDRCIILSLPRMHGVQRGEADFWRAFNAESSSIMGALMDGLASALRNQSTIAVPHAITPRTHDFARWAEAGCRGMEMPNNAFLNSYIENRRSVRVDTAFMDTVVMAIHTFMRDNEATFWEGTFNDLLNQLNTIVALPRPRNWPTSAKGLSDHLGRTSPVLQSIGIEFERARRTATSRTIILRKTDEFLIPSDNDVDDSDDDVLETLPPDFFTLREHGGELPF